eukprot:ctg_477.g144
MASKKGEPRIPPGRVKRLLQTGNDVGHVAASVPVLLGHAVEWFTGDLARAAAAAAAKEGGGSPVITRAHLKRVVEGEERLEFLRQLYRDVSEESRRDGGNLGAAAATGDAPSRRSRRRRRAVADEDEEAVSRSKRRRPTAGGAKSRRNASKKSGKGGEAAAVSAAQHATPEGEQTADEVGDARRNVLGASSPTSATVAPETTTAACTGVPAAAPPDAIATSASAAPVNLPRLEDDYD